MRSETMLFFKRLANLDHSKQLRSGACHLSFDSGDSEPNFLTNGVGGRESKECTSSRHIGSSTTWDKMVAEDRRWGIKAYPPSSKHLSSMCQRNKFRKQTRFRKSRRNILDSATLLSLPHWRQEPNESLYCTLEVTFSTGTTSHKIDLPLWVPKSSMINKSK